MHFTCGLTGSRCTRMRLLFVPHLVDRRLASATEVHSRPSLRMSSIAHAVRRVHPPDADIRPATGDRRCSSAPLTRRAVTADSLAYARHAAAVRALLGLTSGRGNPGPAGMADLLGADLNMQGHYSTCTATAPPLCPSWTVLAGRCATWLKTPFVTSRLVTRAMRIESPRGTQDRIRPCRTADQDPQVQLDALDAEGCLEMTVASCAVTPMTICRIISTRASTRAFLSRRRVRDRPDPSVRTAVVNNQDRT
jgi:hypothetical protein